MSTKLRKSFELRIATRQRSEMLDMTDQIQEVIRRERIKEAVVIAFCPHTTAGMCIQENADPDVKYDLLVKLDAMIPKSESYYRHGEGNSDSHLKATLTGHSATVFVENGRLKLGQWQAVYFCEFDGPRQRTIWLKIAEESSLSGHRS